MQSNRATNNITISDNKKRIAANNFLRVFLENEELEFEGDLQSGFHHLSEANKSLVLSLNLFRKDEKKADAIFFRSQQAYKDFSDFKICKLLELKKEKAQLNAALNLKADVIDTSNLLNLATVSTTRVASDSSQLKRTAIDIAESNKKSKIKKSLRAHHNDELAELMAQVREEQNKTETRCQELALCFHVIFEYPLLKGELAYSDNEIAFLKNFINIHSSAEQRSISKVERLEGISSKYIYISGLTSSIQELETELQILKKELATKRTIETSLPAETKLLIAGSKPEAAANFDNNKLLQTYLAELKAKTAQLTKAQAELAQEVQKRDAAALALRDENTKFAEHLAALDSKTFSLRK